jgi:hypothetical protein
MRSEVLPALTKILKLALCSKILPSSTAFVTKPQTKSPHNITKLLEEGSNQAIDTYQPVRHTSQPRDQYL